MKNGQTIILLHGWGKCKSAEAYYRETTKIFQEKGYTVYVPDMPGFGGAEIPTRPLRLHNYAEFLLSYIRKQNIQSPILIGHSFGGRVIIKFVSTYDIPVKAIILTGTPGFSPVKKVKLIASLVLAKIGGFVFSLPGISHYAEGIRGRFYYVVGARDFYRAEGPMRETFKNIIREELKEKMKHMHQPTLLIWGKEDVIVPVGVAQRMQRTIPGAKLKILPHGTHSVIIDNPKLFANEVLTFLQSI